MSVTLTKTVGVPRTDRTQWSGIKGGGMWAGSSWGLGHPSSGSVISKPYDLYLLFLSKLKPCPSFINMMFVVALKHDLILLPRLA